MKVRGKDAYSWNRSCRGLTLIEMSVVILVLLTLIGISFASIGSIRGWQTAKEASSILREVEVAQRQYLADNPQQAVATLTVAQVAGYLPGSPANLPTLPAVNGVVPTISVTQNPPVAVLGGVAYDPSGSLNDSLWDVGR